MAKIIIKWDAIFIGSACKFDVYLMNTYAGELRCGSTIETSADVGSHVLFFKQKSILGKKADTSFEVVINDETEVVRLKAKFDMNGNFVVRYADNAPHISIASASSGGKMNEINKTLKDIRHETKKTNGCLTGCLTLIFIIFIIGIISSAIFRNKIISDITPSTAQTAETNSQGEDDNSESDKVIYSDDRFKITFVNLVDPKTGITMYNMNLKLENYSDKNVSIYLSEAYVNDTAIEFLGGNVDFDGVAPGKKSICAFMFGYANHDIYDIENIEKIEFKVTLRNSDEFSDVLLSTDTITLNFK